MKTPVLTLHCFKSAHNWIRPFSFSIFSIQPSNLKNRIYCPNRIYGPDSEPTRQSVFVLVFRFYHSSYIMKFRCLSGIETYPAKLNSTTQTISAPSFSAHREKWVGHIPKCWSKAELRFTIALNTHGRVLFSVHCNLLIVSTSCSTRDKRWKMDLPGLSGDTQRPQWRITI